MHGTYIKKMQKTIVGRGVRAPGDVAFHNVQNTQYETGPLFSVNNDWLVKNVKLRVQKCSFAYCTIRLIVYEIIGTQFVPIQHRPIYIQVSKISNKKDFSALVEEPLKLKHNHKYYIGVAVMASSGNGGFSLQIIFCGKNTAISLVNCGAFTAIFGYLQP